MCKVLNTVLGSLEIINIGNWPLYHVWLSVSSCVYLSMRLWASLGLVIQYCVFMCKHIRQCGHTSIFHLKKNSLWSPGSSGARATTRNEIYIPNMP